MSLKGQDEDELALARAAGVLSSTTRGKKAPSVAVVGATGLVGQEMLRILEEREFELSDIRVFASRKSRGRPIDFRSETLECEELGRGCFEGTDLVLMEVESPISREWAPKAVEEGATVVDNSSAWRMSDDVPLVVTEVNPEDLQSHTGIVANPNCTTMTLMPSLAALNRDFGVARVVLTSLQSVSGSGQRGVAELEKQSRRFMDRASGLRRAGATGEFEAGEVYPKPIAFNVVPQCDDFIDGVTTKEEEKLVLESRKILHEPELAISATCVRVPVEVGHSMAVSVQFSRPVHVEEALDSLAEAPGVELVTGHDFPTPLDIAGTDPTWVGRVRPDQSLEGAINFWVCGDNLRKGAALNCIEIGEILVEQGWLKPR